MPLFIAGGLGFGLGLRNLVLFASLLPDNRILQWEFYAHVPVGCGIKTWWPSSVSSVSVTCLIIIRQWKRIASWQLARRKRIRRVTRPRWEIERSKVKVTRPLNDVTENQLYIFRKTEDLQTSNFSACTAVRLSDCYCMKSGNAPKIFNSPSFSWSLYFHSLCYWLKLYDSTSIPRRHDHRTTYWQLTCLFLEQSSNGRRPSRSCK